MEFGTFMTMQSPEAAPSDRIYARALEVAQMAESIGLTRLWLAEHHFTNYAYTSRPIVLLSHIAARTRRIRLGPAIVPLPLHHPLVVAEELATLDVLSGGRVEVGLGKGYQQYQYDRFGMTKGEDEQRYLESIEIVQRALHQPTFSYEGERFRIAPTRLYPQPLQRRAPCWLVVNSSRRESVAVATRAGMNLFTGVLEPISRLIDVRAAYPDLFTDRPGLLIGTQRPVYVAQNEADAADAVRAARWNGRATVRLRYDAAQVHDGVVRADAFPGEPSDEQMRRDYVVIGTAQECVRQLRKIRDGLGCNYFSASFWFGDLSHERVLASMARFARDVMPAFSRVRRTEHA
ncbi:LLM class flavin-dependent oxidoreductase [Trinickia sp.]|uniref:LLM class flavin-dependent oxidoreductase n=1 Tax=Trinickia sp. TaxID=2571163 RepID=UPI003F7E2553